MFTFESNIASFYPYALKIASFYPYALKGQKLLLPQGVWGIISLPI